MSSSENESSFSSEGEEESEKEEFPHDSLEQRVEVPKDIELRCLIVGMCLHPKKDLVALGTIDGPVKIFSYSKDEGNNELISFENQGMKPCRAVAFSDNGEYLFTGASDGLIQVIDLETNSVVNKFNKMHTPSIYCLLSIGEHLLVSGDDDGEIVIWDFRKQTPLASFEHNDDFISSLAVNDIHRNLLATCSDGTLVSFNIRAKKLEEQSIKSEYEYLSMALVKGESNVIVGTSGGPLQAFKWGAFTNISDSFPGHPGPVDSMVAVSEDVVCTGCDDGRIRAVQVCPGRFLGVVGSHNGFSVECLSTSSDRKLLASSSFDHKVKFWDLSALEQVKKNEMYKADTTTTKNKDWYGDGKGFFAGLM